MATCEIWSIKNNLRQSINYIINPEKTINEDYGKNICRKLEPFYRNYINEKTHYVTYENRIEDDIYEDMLLYKRIYNKTDGILGFHAYQSFKEGEVTPDIAHEIGVKLAEEMWPNYQVVISTHQNTKHIHNHFIINSVSFENGKKYNNNKSNYSKLRYLSDSLCEEYGLSTLEENTKYRNSFKNSIKDNEYYNIIKEDIDYLINESIIEKQFLTNLKNLGYNYYIKYGKLTIYRDGNEKVRLDKVFGNEYTLDNIIKRLSGKYVKKEKILSHNTIFNNYKNKNKTHKGIFGLYLYYCYLLKVFPTEHPKQNLPYSIRKDIKEMEKLAEEIRFMQKYNINTIEDLLEVKNDNSEYLSNLLSKKENLWRKYKRSRTEAEKIEIYKEINDIKDKIKKSYKIRDYCNDIEIRSKKMEDNINNFDKELKLGQKEKYNVRN